MNLHHLKKLNKNLSYLNTTIPHTPLYLVGGCVRDVLLGRADDPVDIDVTAPGIPGEIRDRIDNSENKSDFSFFHTEKFGTMTIIPKANDQISSKQYELTPLRTETGYSDHRHPDEIQWSSDIVLDSHRRDFTINALYYTHVTFDQIKKTTTAENKTSDIDSLTAALQKQGIAYDPVSQILIIQSEQLIEQSFSSGVPDKTKLFALTKSLSPDAQPRELGILLDPTGGWFDLIEKKIQAVGDADARVHEDALRIIRALRFGIQLQGFDYEKKTRLALQKRYFLIQEVATERISQEIWKVLHTDNFFGFVALLDELNLLRLLFPALERNKHIDQPIRYHPFDNYTHMMLVLYELEKINKSPLLKLAALYHDVGKRDQYHMQSIKMSVEDGRKMYGSWINHAICGADYTRRDMQSLGLSRKQVDEIVRYVSLHMRPGEIFLSKPLKRKHKLRLLLSEAGFDRVSNLLDLTIADMRGQYNPLQTSSVEKVYELKRILEELHHEEGQFQLSDLSINGHDIMNHFSLQPGPEVKNLLQTAFERVLKDIGKRNNKKRILKHLDSL